MKPKHLYMILCVVGIVLPYMKFVPWLLENGLDISLLIREITGSHLAAFAWMDVIVSALALFVFIYYDGRKNGINNLWLPVLGTLTVGVSLGLPLYLLLRELHFEKNS